MSETKTCRKCLVEKSLSDFYEKKSSRDGFRHECKPCVVAKSQNNYFKLKEDPEKLSKIRTRWIKYGALKKADPVKHELQKIYSRRAYCKKLEIPGIREKLRAEYKRSNIARNSDPIRKKRDAELRRVWMAKRKQDPDVLAKMQAYNRIKAARRKAQPGYHERTNERARLARANNPNLRIKSTLIQRMRYLIGSKPSDYKDSRSTALMGCATDHFRKHIESLWEPWMSWDNYGSRSECWSIDHIIPCSSFDLTDERQQRKCFHYSNCRPMLHADNIRKHDKFVTE